MQKNKNIPIDHSDRWALFLQGICIKFLSMKLYVFHVLLPQSPEIILHDN